MFGFVRPNMDDLTEADRARYNAVYCGLCRELGRRHGLMGKMSLTFDMTFLTIFLQSLYEPEETVEQNRCMAHPNKVHQENTSAATSYCADMTVALMYHKLMDDWQDDHNLLKKGLAQSIHKSYEQVKKQWPAQCERIEKCMAELNQAEQAEVPQPEKASDCFGRLMSALMCWKTDFWQGALTCFGYSLGRFIYMMDAAVDYASDVKKKRFNPLVVLQIDPLDARPFLEEMLGPASQVLEELPLVQDIEILRNTLYSGVWQMYNIRMKKEEEHERST